MSRTFGFELEVSGGGYRVNNQLRELGLSAHTQKCGYHCGCSRCRYDRPGAPIAFQSDCTADAEFVTKILEYGTEQAEAAIFGMGTALVKSAAGCAGGVGNHVHVYNADLDTAANVRLLRIFTRYARDLDEIAQANRPAVRSYNGAGPAASSRLWQDAALEAPSGGYGYSLYDLVSTGWISFGRGGGNTVEFRLWNSTRAGWRIRTHVGISVAIVEAAFAGTDVTEHDDRPFEEVLAPWLDGPTWAGILRQRYSKGGIR